MIYFSCLSEGGGCCSVCLCCYESAFKSAQRQLWLLRSASLSAKMQNLNKGQMPDVGSVGMCRCERMDSDFDTIDNARILVRYIRRF